MTIENFNQWFIDDPINLEEAKQGKYGTIFLLRRAESNCIFRTDGGIVNEITKAGINRDDLPNEFFRVLISKRKQVAPERRTGRMLLHNETYGALAKNCLINDNMCGECIDCRLYGSAIGENNYSIKSRVITDEAFSLLPYRDITKNYTFNALYENGTMRKIEKGEVRPATSINKDEVVRPGAIFLDIETLIDLTMDEFLYTLGNILRTKRYGAMTSRLGKMENMIIGIAFSNCELFSNLEWTQRTYDILCSKLSLEEGETPQFPLDMDIVYKSSKEALKELIEDINGVRMLKGDEITQIISQVNDIFSNQKKLKDKLNHMTK
ncbi:MAG: type I-D CRISPR-associated protein Cas7/Csc2 [Atribacterota bacterium]